MTPSGNEGAPSATSAAGPYTLLGVLMQGGGPLCAAAMPSGGTCALAGVSFMREYARRATNALLWMGLIVVTALLLRRLGRLRKLWAEGSRIPGPPCTSFHGHSNVIPAGGNLPGYLSELHGKYGPIVKLWLGPSQLLVSVADVTLIKEVLTQAQDKFPLTGRAFRLAFGRSNLFVPAFEKVQNRRESLEINLNGKLHERSSLKVADCIMEMIDSVTPKGLVVCREISQLMAFYLTGATLFGEAFLAWSKAAVYNESLMVIARDASFWASYTVRPIWKKGYWKYRKLCSQLKCLTRDIVQQCVKHYQSSVQIGEVSHPRRNQEEACGESFIIDDILAKGMLLEEINDYLISEDEPCADIMSMLFHGCLNAASLIDSILTRIAKSPKLQEKIFSEVVEVNKGNNGPHLCDVRRMPFLLASIYESARLLPTGSLLQRCSLKHDLNLRTSMTIPAGTILVVPMQLVQTDDSVWGKDASQFNPLRFLSKSVDHEEIAAGLEDDSPLTISLTALSGHKFDRNCVLPCSLNDNAGFLPFGYGKRACVGQNIAIFGISTLLASLLYVYEIRLHVVPENDAAPAMDKGVSQHPPSHKILFTRRN